jgi:AhpD family alkylhydroperoxidase
MIATTEYWKIAPEANKAMAAISMYINASGLDHKLVHLLYLRVSQINGCAYCCDMHTHEALAAGETAQRLHVVAAWREAEDLFNEAERAALAWAEALTRFADAGDAEHAARDAAYQKLLDHYAPKQAVDITFAIASMNSWNRIAVAFHRGPEKR